MFSARLVVLLLAALGVLASARVDPPPPPAPGPGAAPLLQRLDAALEASRKAPPGDRRRLEDELLDASGHLLDSCADQVGPEEVSPEEVSFAAHFWFQLAEDRGLHDARAARVSALRSLPRITASLDSLLRVQEAKLATQVGRPAPAWGATTLEGGRLDSTELQGLVLLSFWATWNPHCRDLIEQRLAPLATRRSPGLTIVHVGVAGNGESPTRELAFFAEAPCPGARVYDAGGDLAATFGADGVPLLCLVGPDGTVLARGPGWDVIDQVEALLTEPR